MLYITTLAKALAVESWNNATTIVSHATLLEPLAIISNCSLLSTPLGVIALVKYSSHSVFCGIESSFGTTVVPVATAPV